MEQAVFLSYRRKDQPGYVARLGDDINRAFGEVVFRDVDSLLAGQDWQQELKKKVAQAKVMIAIIGHQWESRLVQNQGSSNPDYVRLELNTAQELGIPVIPVLLDRVSMPDESTLGDLAWLHGKQSHHLSDAQGRWTFDSDRLNEQIAQICSLQKHQAPTNRRVILGMLGSIASIFGLAWLAWTQFKPGESDLPVQPVKQISQTQTGDKSTQIGEVTGTLTINNSGSERKEENTEKDTTQ